MFDSSLVVQSAASSFNNAALFMPDFFISAILALPIFIIFWIFADKINLKIAPLMQNRNQSIGMLVSGITIFWLLTHGIYGTLRDSVSSINYIVAFALFWAFAYFTREILVLGILPRIWNKIKTKWHKYIAIAIMLAVITIIGLFGAPGWLGFIIQSGSVILGVLAGWLLFRKNKTLGGVYSVMTVLMFLVVAGLVMQPEFFRFGQLGSMTVVHLLAITLFAVLAVSNVIFRHIKPRNWISKSWYKRLLLLAGLILLLAFATLLMTESVLIFLGLAGVISVIVFIIARHQAESSIIGMIELGHGLWLLTLGAFGLLTGIPLLICVAILIWRMDGYQKIWNLIKKALL